MQTLKFNLSDRIAVEISGNDPLEIFPAAAFWLSLPTQCPKCQAPLVLEYTTPQTYKYYKLKCTGPTPHAVNLGQKQIDSSLYYDRAKTWETFRAGANEDDQAAATEANNAPAHQNAGGSWRSGTIVGINDLYTRCVALKLTAAERVKPADLGKYSDEQLSAARDFLKDLIANAPPATTKPDDDIPF